MFDAITCMAVAIYFEARGEPPVGRIAVAQTIQQRVHDHRYPDNVCDVVKQGNYYSWDNTKPIIWFRLNKLLMTTEERNTFLTENEFKFKTWEHDDRFFHVHHTSSFFSPIIWLQEYQID